MRAMDLIALMTSHFDDSVDTLKASTRELAEPLAAAVELLFATLANDGKILACGNGGSAADAQHFIAELVGRFERDRLPLAGIALNTDTSIMTAVGNDYGFDSVFERQVSALGQTGDILVAISTSGNSPNVIRAIEAARERDMVIIALTGKGGGKIAELLSDTDIHLCVPHDRTMRIQEVHIVLLHAMCDGIDALLLGDPYEEQPSDHRRPAGRIPAVPVGLRPAGRGRRRRHHRRGRHGPAHHRRTGRGQGHRHEGGFGNAPPAGKQGRPHQHVFLRRRGPADGRRAHRSRQGRGRPPGIAGRESHPRGQRIARGRTHPAERTLQRLLDFHPGQHRAHQHQGSPQPHHLGHHRARRGLSPGTRHPGRRRTRRHCGRRRAWREQGRQAVRIRQRRKPGAAAVQQHAKDGSVSGAGC